MVAEAIAAAAARRPIAAIMHVAAVAAAKPVAANNLAATT